MITWGVQPSEIRQLTWPYYLTLCLGHVEQRHQQEQDAPEQRDPIEQAILQQDAMAILRGDVPSPQPAK